MRVLPYRLQFFNSHIAAAQDALARGYRNEALREDARDRAKAHLAHALRRANQMRDRSRRALVLRILNWMRAA